MAFDQKVPIQLKDLQVWFGKVIQQPIDDNSQINSIAPSGTKIEQEACQYVAPSRTLRPHQRIQLYNQQYWWRLLTNLQEIYPFVTRLFGHHDFNRKIAVPYLKKYPPRHWSMNKLGESLPFWIDKCYKESDKKLIYDCSRLDHAYNQIFFEKQLPSLNELVKGKDIAGFLDVEVKLQPFIHLFQFKSNLFQFRTDMLKQEVEYWCQNEFPSLEKEKDLYNFILFRDSHLNIGWKEIEPEEYTILLRFKRGTSIEGLCEWLERQDAKTNRIAGLKLQTWLQSWVVNEWLTPTLD